MGRCLIPPTKLEARHSGTPAGSTWSSRSAKAAVPETRPRENTTKAISIVANGRVVSIIKPIAATTAPPTEQKYLGQLLEGLRYARDHSSIRRVILIAGVSTFFGRGIMEIFPALVVMIFDGGSAQLAALMAAAGAGAIGVSVIFSFLRSHHHLPAMVLTGAVGVGISLFLFANVSQFVYGLTVTALLGFFATMVSIGSQSEMQMKVDNELRGRVMSLWTLVIIGGPAIGSIVAGALASNLGSTYTLLLFAALSLMSTAIVAIHRPAGKAAQNQE